jgi:hypothetical protein
VLLGTTSQTPLQSYGEVHNIYEGPSETSHGGSGGLPPRKACFTPYMFHSGLRIWYRLSSSVDNLDHHHVVSYNVDDFLKK